MKNNHDKKIVEYAKNIKATMKENEPDLELIDSPEKLDAFLKKEKLYKAKIKDHVKIIQKLAQDIASGKRNVKIDLEKIPRTSWPNVVIPDKREAENLYWDLSAELKKIQNPTYGKTYQVFVKFVFWLQLFLALTSFLVDSKNTETSEEKAKKKQFLTILKQMGDLSQKTPKEMIYLMKKVMSLVKI